jgi:hypothetical protein
MAALGVLSHWPSSRARSGRLPSTAQARLSGHQSLDFARVSGRRPGVALSRVTVYVSASNREECQSYQRLAPNSDLDASQFDGSRAQQSALAQSFNSLAERQHACGPSKKSSEMARKPAEIGPGSRAGPAGCAPRLPTSADDPAPAPETRRAPRRVPYPLHPTKPKSRKLSNQWRSLPRAHRWAGPGPLVWPPL